MTTNWRKIETEADLPEAMTAVLVCSPRENDVNAFVLVVAYLYEYDDGTREWIICGNVGKGYGVDTFTHWMPLPEPPEGDK